jgi:hypothetical protein
MQPQVQGNSAMIAIARGAVGAVPRGIAGATKRRANTRGTKARLSAAGCLCNRPGGDEKNRERKSGLCERE